MVSRFTLASWGFMLLALLGACVAYRPGLNGSFVFDDFANLPSLGASGPIRDTGALARYLTSGHADPTGRPLSMASFLIDATDWPADPKAFKRTNLLLHLINGTLLFRVLTGLGRALAWDERRRSIAAIMGASLWLLHPFFVSTVLYVVQREAMLPATFALAALLSYLRARTRAAQGRTVIAKLWIIFGVGLCTFLATLAKANGVLIPLLTLVVHSALPEERGEKGRALHSTCIFTLGPPAAVVIAYVAWVALASIGDPPIPIRGWSVMQRLLTEPAILWDYVAQLWLLKPTSSSLLHDDVRAATSLWAPWYTSISIAGWALLSIAAWRLRRRFPAPSLAILFFLAGHLVESSSLALELYFEHRNYLPSLLLFWWAGDLLGRMRSLPIVVTALLSTTLTLGGLAFANATVWGDVVAQATDWARRHEESPRAQAYAAQVKASAGRLEAARVIIERAALRFKGEPQVALNLIDIHCDQGSLSPGDAEYVRDSFREAQREPGPLLVHWFTGAVHRALDGSCEGLTRTLLESILDGAETNPRIAEIPGRRQDIYHLRGVLALSWQEPDQALIWFDRALSSSPSPEAALSQAAELGRSGHPGLGLQHLAYFDTLPPTPRRAWREGMPWLHERILEKQRYWSNEETHLRAELRAAVPTKYPM